MKIAVLLFGQPRFWDLSYESILQETSFEGCTTDYYFHFWDRVAYGHLDHESGYNLTDEEKDKVKQYGVKGFPSLFIEKDGNVESFPHRTYEKISDYLNNL